MTMINNAQDESRWVRKIKVADQSSSPLAALGLMKNIVVNENRPVGPFSFSSLFLHHLYIDRDTGRKA